MQPTLSQLLLRVRLPACTLTTQRDLFLMAVVHPVRIPYSNLSKEDLIKEIINWEASTGEKVDSKWSKPELRSLLKEIYEKHPTSADPMKGVADLNLADLRAKCEELHLEFNKNHTRGDLLRKVRKYSDSNYNGVATDLVTFGSTKGNSTRTSRRTSRPTRPGCRRWTRRTRIAARGFGGWRAG